MRMQEALKLLKEVEIEEKILRNGKITENTEKEKLEISNFLKY